MAETELEALVRALGAAVGGAQAAIATRQRGSVERRFDQKEGRTEAVTWTCRVPSGRNGAGPEETIELPLLSLRSHRLFQVAEVSVRFEGRIAGVGGPPAPPASLLRRVARWLWARRKRRRPGVQQIEIRYAGSEPLTAEVRVDGDLLGQSQATSRRP